MNDARKDSTEVQPPAKSAASAEQWREFGKEFRQLKDEEKQARPAPRTKDALLWACGIYRKGLESLQTKRIELTEEEKRLRYQFKSGAPDPRRSNRHSRSRKHPLPDGWRLNGETSADFAAQFRALAKRAGSARGCPDGADPIDFWLGQLHGELLKHRSKHLFSKHLFGVSRDVILGVCEASATFCSQLEEQAPEQSIPGTAVGGGRKQQTDLAYRERKIWDVIQRGQTGRQYCRELDNAGVRPRRTGPWKDGPGTYLGAYDEGGRWRQMVQDEKSKIRRKAGQLAKHSPASKNSPIGNPA